MMLKSHLTRIARTNCSRSHTWVLLPPALRLAVQVLLLVKAQAKQPAWTVLVAWVLCLSMLQVKASSLWC